MANIFDYIKWRGDLSMRQDPFNEADSLVLSALSYLPFELAVDMAPLPCSLAQITSVLLEIPDIEKKLLLKNDFPLIKALTMCKRFGSMTLINYENRIDEESQTQFSAITLRIKPGHYAIVFRGTDSSIVGWKENFNMAFTCPVPAQTSAVEYVENAIAAMPGRYILCGHSKGGNLAIYAAAFCRSEYCTGIGKIYSLDSPGFDEKILNTVRYKSICRRIRAFVPQASLVGIMLSRDDKCRIIKSSRIGPLQHDLYSWDIMGKNFIYMDDMSKGSKFADKTLRSWLSEMSYDRREKFIDAMFSVIEETGAKTINELAENLIKSTRTITKSFQNLDEETRDMLSSILRLFAESVKKTAIGSRRASKT